MLWVMMGMYVPFVAPSLTLKRCPCATSVNCNIVRIALTGRHWWGEIDVEKEWMWWE